MGRLRRAQARGRPSRGRRRGAANGAGADAKAKKKVVVSHVSSCNELYVQEASEAAVEALRAAGESLNAALIEAPPTAGAFSAKRGALCAAKFSFDNMWYRAKIVECDPSGTGKADVVFIDYGNGEKIDAKDLAALPSSCADAEPFAREVRLAFTSKPDEDWQPEAHDYLANGILNQPYMMGRAYTDEGATYVTLTSEEDGADVADTMISNGLLFSQSRREERHKALAKKYEESQEIAMEERRNMWQYGDCRPELAREFGMNSGK